MLDWTLTRLEQMQEAQTWTEACALMRRLEEKDR